MSIRNGHARWAFDLSTWRPSRNDLLLATACIQPEEKERLDKFVFRNDFDASLIGRLLLRKFVTDTIPIRYDEICFERDAKGRPHLCGHSEHQIDFNVSHQGNYAVLAGCSGSSTNATADKPKTLIGVDVMNIEYSGGKPLHEFFRLMHRNFSPTEWAFIKSQSGNELAETQAFMRHWCLKESYVKNVGVGITVDLQTISFAIQTPDLSIFHPVTNTTLSVDGKPMQNWLFEESLLDNEHCVAVALHNPNGLGDAVDINPFEKLNFKHLIKDSVPLLEPDDEYCDKVLNKVYKS